METLISRLVTEIHGGQYIMDVLVSNRQDVERPGELELVLQFTLTNPEENPYHPQSGKRWLPVPQMNVIREIVMDEIDFTQVL